MFLSLPLCFLTCGTVTFLENAPWCRLPYDWTEVTDLREGSRRAMVNCLSHHIITRAHDWQGIFSWWCEPWFLDLGGFCQALPLWSYHLSLYVLYSLKVGHESSAYLQGRELSSTSWREDYYRICRHTTIITIWGRHFEAMQISCISLKFCMVVVGAGGSWEWFLSL